MGSIGCQEHEEIVQTFEEKDEVGASGEEGFRTSGRRLSRAGVPSRLSNSSKAKTRVSASEVDHSRSSAQALCLEDMQPEKSPLSYWKFLNAWLFTTKLTISLQVEVLLPGVLTGCSNAISSCWKNRGLRYRRLRSEGNWSGGGVVLYQIAGLLLQFWDAYRFYPGQANIAY